MSVFDIKYKIGNRRKTIFVSAIMLLGCGGALWAMAILMANPDLMPGNVHTLNEFIAAFPRFMLVTLGMLGLAFLAGFIAYKILSWIDRPHAVAALRSIKLAHDPYDD